jgi:hypothetical protein
VAIAKYTTAGLDWNRTMEFLTVLPHEHQVFFAEAANLPAQSFRADKDFLRTNT